MIFCLKDEGCVCACARTGMFAFIYRHAIMFVNEVMKEEKGRNDLMLLFLNFNFFVSSFCWFT